MRKFSGGEQYCMYTTLIKALYRKREKNLMLELIKIEGLASKGYAKIGKGNDTLYINMPGSRGEVTFILVKSFDSYFVLSTKRKAIGLNFDYDFIARTYYNLNKDALKTIRYLAVFAKNKGFLKYFKENLTPKKFIKLVLLKEHFSVKFFNEWFPNLLRIEQEEEEDIKVYNFKITIDDLVRGISKDNIIDFIKAGADKVAAVGLSDILYGKIYIVDKLPGSVIALYSPDDDMVKIDKRAAKKYNKDMVRNFIHELGHRLLNNNRVDIKAVRNKYNTVKYGSIESDIQIGDIFRDNSGRNIEIIDIDKGRVTVYKVLRDGKEASMPSGAFRHMEKIKGGPMTDINVWKPSAYAMKNVNEYFCELFSYGLVNNNKLYKDFLKRVIR